MLHYLDDLDSKLESMRASFERDAGLDNAWTSYNASLGRPLLNIAKFTEEKEALPETAGPAPGAGAAETSPPIETGLEMPRSAADPPPLAATVLDKR